MKNLVVTSLVATLAALTSAGCQQDNRSIERKLDQIIDKLNKMPAGGAAAQRPSRPEHDRGKTYSVPVDGDAFDGPADALVTIVKAYDYACPYCEKVRGTMDELRQKYGNDLRVVYKQLVVHPRNAMAGALAFCAAAKQGKHKEMDAAIWDKGFKVRQMDLSDVPPPAEAQGEAAKPQKCWDTPEGCKNVVGYAQELGLNLDQFKADMKGPCMQLVQADMKHLQALSVSATPGFFVNGRFISGAVPIENFIAVIDEELKKAKEAVQRGVPRDKYYQTQVVEKGAKSI